MLRTYSIQTQVQLVVTVVWSIAVTAAPAAAADSNVSRTSSFLSRVTLCSPFSPYLVCLPFDLKHVTFTQIGKQVNDRT